MENLLKWLMILSVILKISDTTSVQLSGVNLPSQEYSVDDTGTGFYIGELPSREDMVNWKIAGFNLIRYGFTWQFLQPDLTEDFDSYYLGNLTNEVNNLLGMGYTVILDCHNYARYNGLIIGQAPGAPSNSQFAALWSKLANTFGGQPRIIYGLMNEPHDLDFDEFAITMQDAINAIRQQNAAQPILVSGTGYDGIDSWIGDSSGPLMTLTDPGENMIFDIHTYFDDNGSGENGTNCHPWATKSDTFMSVTDRIRSINGKAMLTEFGGMATPECVNIITSVLSFLDANADVWAGWTAWGAELDGPPTILTSGLYKTTRDPPADELYLSTNDSRANELVSNALQKHGFVAAASAANKLPAGQVAVPLDINIIECFPNTFDIFDPRIIFDLVAGDPIIVPSNGSFFQFLSLSTTSLTIQSSYGDPQLVLKAVIADYIAVIYQQCLNKGFKSGGYADIPGSQLRIVLSPPNDSDTYVPAIKSNLVAAYSSSSLNNGNDVTTGSMSASIPASSVRTSVSTTVSASASMRMSVLPSSSAASTISAGAISFESEGLKSSIRSASVLPSSSTPRESSTSVLPNSQASSSAQRSSGNGHSSPSVNIGELTLSFATMLLGLGIFL